MAKVSLNSAFFTGLQDSNGDSPVLTTGSYIQLHQRTASPPALPTISSSAGTTAFFHNEQDASAGNFATATGTPSFGAKGIRLGTSDYLNVGSPTTNNHVRNGTWFSEGIVSFEGPFNTLTTRSLDKAIGVGELRLEYLNGNWRFAVLDDQSNKQTFTNITVPLTFTGVGSVPKPFYFRMVREIPSSGTGQLHLVVNDGSSTQTQIITGVAAPITYSPSVVRFGEGGAGVLNVYWWRGIGSSDAATVGTLTSNYWSSPKVFDTTSYFSHGTASTADSGTNDQYWHFFGVTSGDSFSGITRNGGGKIEARVVATNTAPTGSTSSLFSGSYFTVQDIPENLSDPQGRYLAIEWKYTPGTDWPLSSGSVHIIRDTSEVATATHFPNAQGSNPSVINVSGEGTTQGTLPYTPERSSTVERTLRTRKSRFSYPYTYSRPLGTVSRRSYKVRWVLTASEKATLLYFFEARDGIEQAFTWTAPGDNSTSLAALASNLEISQLSPSVFQIDAILSEVK